MVRRRNTLSSLQERIAFFQLSQPPASSAQEDDDDSEIDDPTDPNNNIERKSTEQGPKSFLSRTASTSSGELGMKQPSYVPSYVRTLTGEHGKRQSSTNPSARVKRTVSLNRCTAHKSDGSESSQQYGHYEPCKTLAQLREKYRAPTIPEVHVKEAVAAMESRIEPSKKTGVNIVQAKAKPAHPKPRTPPKPIIRPKGPVDTLSLEVKTKHRRSMSDPNLNKVFWQIKQLWDQKVESEKQPLHDGSRTGSFSSINSIESNKSLDKKSLGIESDESQSKKIRFPSISISPPSPNTPKPLAPKEPIVPPRPKPRRGMRARACTLGQLNVTEFAQNTETTGGIPSTGMALAQAMTSAANETLSVSQKAMLFGGAKRKSCAQEDKDEVSPQPGSQSPAFQRHLVRSWSNDCADKQNEDEKPEQKEENQSHTEASYARPYNNTEINNSFKTSTRRKNMEEEESIVSDLQKQAKLAKDRRKRERTVESPTTATDDDDDEVAKRKDSFKNVVRRRSKDNIRQSPLPSQSPLAVRKTEDTIFGPATSGPPATKQTFSEEAKFTGRRRASTLQKLMEQNNSSFSSLSNLSSSGSFKSNKTLEYSKNSASDLKPRSQSAIRPTNLPLHSRERSHTEGYKRQTDNISIASLQKSGSTGNINLVSNEESAGSITPSTPDKRSSGYSEGEFSSASDVLIKSTKPIKPSAPPPPPPSTNESTSSYLPEEGNATPEQGDTTSLSSVDSNSNQGANTTGIGELNLLEEYDKIAKEIGGGEEVTDSVTTPVSQDCSSESVDSGFRNSLEVPSSNRRSNTNSWSDFDNSDEDDSILEPSSKPQANLPRTPSPSISLKEPNEVKLHNIAKELLSTEKSYVAVLHLIDQVFHKQVLDAAISKHIMPEQVVNGIFCHVPAIYQFHSSFLLPQLTERLQNWETNPRIGDIMTKAAPFLKMYSLYVQNFDEAMNTIKTWSEKSSAFSAIIKNIQQTPECNFLTLQHHMLSPVQRVPRYRLLLEDYVKRLPEEAEDRGEAEKALQLITVAATHSNETMKKIEKFHKLVNVFNGLVDVNFDIVDVTRELLKEGKIIKISARNGEKYERYLYLFSDMLLCCTPLRRLQGKSYKVTAKIDLDGMKISEIKNPTISNVFCVNGLQKSMEFASNTPEDKDSWVHAITYAIDQHKNRLQTFKRGESTQEEFLSPVSGQPPSSPVPPPSPSHLSKQPLIEIADADLGTRAPRWIKDHEVTMCMCCSKPFNKLLRRRHHCRACGRVVCSECSEHKISLHYDPGKPLKVCATCYDVLTGRHHCDNMECEKKGVLEVEADAVSENSIIADYLFFTENEKKRTWTKTWCVIPKDELCLYFYGAHQDVRAQMTMPLPGFEVIDIFFSDHKYCFKLKQARKVLLFAGNDKDCIDRWKYALSQASKGEDLDREDVYWLGRVPEKRESTSEESEESQEEEVEQETGADAEKESEEKTEKETEKTDEISQKISNVNSKETDGVLNIVNENYAKKEKTYALVEDETFGEPVYAEIL